MTATPTPFNAGGLTFCLTSAFDFQWSSADCHYSCDQTGVFWKPDPVLEGFACFGTMCVPTTQQQNGNNLALCAQIPDPSTPNPPFAYAADFTLMWTDKGTGNSNNGSCWIIEAPAGYVALGSVFIGGYDKPATTDYLCIRSDLALEIGTSSGVWTDKGSGGTYGDLACYAFNLPDPSTIPQLMDARNIAFCANSFVVNTTYNQPILPVPVIVLPATVVVPDVPPAPPPVDSGAAAVPVQGFTIQVPCPAFNDDERSCDWKAANPLYLLERWYTYTPIASLENDSSVIQEMSYTAEVGTSQSSSLAFEASVGGTLSAELKLGFAGGVSSMTFGLSISAGFKADWEHGSTSTQGTTVTNSLKVPPNTKISLSQYSVTFKVNRPDGTYITTQDGGLTVNANQFYDHQTSLQPQPA